MATATLTRTFPDTLGWSDMRGQWSEIIRFTRGAETIHAKDVVKLFAPALPATYVEFDKKGRGDALNTDLYGYDPIERVAVIQARHAFRRHKNGFMNVRKTYFLAGFNELSEEPFRHPISSAAVRGAINAKGFLMSKAGPIEVVRAAQKWMWQVNDAQLARAVRQGDVLVVPEARFRPEFAHVPRSLVLAGSHHVEADGVIEQGGRIMALNPRLEHVKGQHEPVRLDGWCSVRVAREVDAWDFAVRLGD